MKYGFPQNSKLNSIIFIDFYVFFAFFLLSITILFVLKNFYAQFFFYCMGIISAVLMQYTEGDLFTIKLFIYSIWIVTIILNYTWLYNIVFSLISSFVFLSVQFHPEIFGAVESTVQVQEPDSVNLITASAYLIITISVSTMYRFVIERWKEQIATAEHLNMVMTQLSSFNHELQNAVKLSGQEAAQQERMRITRDMHDSCGYVFVNIIALMEAAESSPSMDKIQIEEAFSTVRNLASNGLKETRKTLHAIRDIQNPIESSIDAIYEIKKIFEKVTGIHVTIQSGNIKKDYGRAINSIIVHTMQEALTNAIRHGRAENIFVAFWDENDELTMRVEDDGIGSKQIVKGIGLAGMEERLSRVGGVLELSSLDRGGFKLMIRIPLMRNTMEN